MIEARNITKYYGARQALSDVSFLIEPGEVVGFLGVNGAGKSTTMRILTGFFPPTFGQALIGGLDPAAIEAKRLFGYLPEANPLPRDMRVSEFLVMRARLKGVAKKNIQSVVGLAAEETRISAIQDRIIGQLSKGYRQRVGLAEALLNKPQVLILDEPTAGLDPQQAEETRNLIAAIGQKTTVLLSSHILHEVELLCKRVVVINQGKIIAQGNTLELCLQNIEERTLVLEIFTHEPVRDVFKSIAGVKAVVIGAPAADGALVIRVTMDAKLDLRRDLAALCVRHGWLVKHIAYEPVGLEDMFRRLLRMPV